MDPPSPTTKKQMKEKKKARKKSTSSPIDQSSRATSSESWSSVPSSYLSTFAASTTPDASVSTTSPSPAALLAQLPNGGEPGWRSSINAAWAQAQKNVYIRWVREKREKVARAEEALAAGRGSEEEVEVSPFHSFYQLYDVTSSGRITRGPSKLTTYYTGGDDGAVGGYRRRH